MRMKPRNIGAKSKGGKATEGAFTLQALIDKKKKLVDENKPKDGAGKVLIRH